MPFGNQTPADGKFYGEARIWLHRWGHLGRRRRPAGVGAATDSRQLLDSRVHSSLVVAHSRVRHTRVGRTLEYVLAGI